MFRQKKLVSINEIDELELTQIIEKLNSLISKITAQCFKQASKSSFLVLFTSLKYVQKNIQMIFDILKKKNYITYDIRQDSITNQYRIQIKELNPYAMSEIDLDPDLEELADEGSPLLNPMFFKF